MGRDVLSLDWSSAEVHDGKLVVALDSKPPKEWKDAFARTTRLLNRGTWDEVTLKKGRVSLASIVPGEEERARHFLESVVLEANSAIESPEQDDEGSGEAADRAEQDDEDEDPQDREMTEHVRSFAERSGGD